jgi:3-mercaptopyruvate sulfurtransferase SseA
VALAARLEQDGVPLVLDVRGPVEFNGPLGHIREAMNMPLAAGITDRDKTPLFRSAAGKTRLLTDRPMHRVDAYQMVRRRTAEAG